MDDSEITSILPASWPQVLEKVRRTLRRAEAAARQREANLAEGECEEQGTELAPKVAALSGVLEKRQLPIEEARKLAEETDSLLADVEGQLQDWLKALRRLTKLPRGFAARRR